MVLGLTRVPETPALAAEDKRLYTAAVRFEWDPRKAEANVRAHGVSFAEAVTVLEDALALTQEDPAAAEEERFVTLGLSDQATLLVVVYALPGARHHPHSFRVEGRQASEGTL